MTEPAPPQPQQAPVQQAPVQRAQAPTLRLYGYWRSSSSWRVRIALALKGLDYEARPVHLVREGGEQHRPEYRARNPQALVPLLEHGEFRLQQSLAICEYLDSLAPTPALVPHAPQAAAQVRALAQQIACEIQPLNNLRVLQQLGSRFGAGREQIADWYRYWLTLGFDALEAALPAVDGPYACGSDPTLVDVCLVPQMYNARRYEADLSPYPRLRAIEAHCLRQPAFADTAPEAQPDAAA